MEIRTHITAYAVSLLFLTHDWGAGIDRAVLLLLLAGLALLARPGLAAPPAGDGPPLLRSLQVASAACLAASVAVGYVMQQAYQSATPEQYFGVFMGLFIVLFAASGIGNGSTFRMIGVIFDRTQAGPVLGWTSAIAAYGAFVAPIVIGNQITAGTPQLAMYGFAVFYAVCLVLNWWFYLRRRAYVKNP
jgi:nitrate/nitrite transporter NarK